MQETAGAIAAGDLSQRIDIVDEHTEVGRLGHRAQRDDAADRNRVRSARRVGRTAAAVRRRRVARAAHTAHVDPRLRGAVPARRGRPARRSRQGDAPHRRGSGPHGFARRRHAAARAPRPGPPARTPARRPHPPHAATRSTTRARSRRTGRSTSRRTAPCSCPATSCGSGRCSATCCRTPTGTRRPTRRCTCASLNGDDEAVIEVADEGPGMATEDANRVFERFWRSDPSRTRSSGGAGLGLAIVAAIAAAHGGRAEVQSAPGQGSVFRVHLPHRVPLTAEGYDSDPADAAIDRVDPRRRPRRPLNSTPANSFGSSAETRTLWVGQTRTTSLPRWSPEKRRTSASGARSMPSSSCTRALISPAASQPASSLAASA